MRARYSASLTLKTSAWGSSRWLGRCLVCAGHQDDGIIRAFAAGFTAHCGACGHDCRILGRLGPLPGT